MFIVCSVDRYTALMYSHRVTRHRKVPSDINCFVGHVYLVDLSVNRETDSTAACSYNLSTADISCLSLRNRYESLRDDHGRLQKIFPGSDKAFPLFLLTFHQLTLLISASPVCLISLFPAPVPFPLT